MPADRPVPAAAGPTRRGALLASMATVGLATAGCGEAGPAPRVSSAAAEGDEAVLAAVRTELAGALALVGATRRRHRSLRGRLAPLEDAHATQLAALDPDGETAAPTAPTVDPDAGTALARLRDAEERLQRRLLTWAVAVDSGPLARVLAAAAAGSAQHLAALAPAVTSLAGLDPVTPEGSA